MSFVAVAVVGGAAITAYASNRAADRSAQATTQSTSQAVDAQLESTRLQIAEIQRQFDTQMALLEPFVATQRGASSAYSNLLGFAPERTSSVPATETVQSRTSTRRAVDGPTRKMTPPGQTGGAPSQGVMIDGRTGEVIGPRGDVFRDPNVDYTRLSRDSAQDTELGRAAFGNILAPPDPDSDILVRRTGDTRLSDRVAATELVGPEFETSPGYEFMVEQAMREVERRNSAGGNYGGRALLEAQRRAEGVAAGEYYNWLNARAAELERGDRALQYDITRGDAAMENYLGRRSMDFSRQDAAIASNEANRAYDLQRQDQAYYNYLASLGAAAGLNVGAPHAVAASESAGARTAGAYANQGNYLSSLFRSQGDRLADAEVGRYEGLNNAVQGGISNWLTHRSTL